MARKKAVPVEEQESNLESRGLPEGEATGKGEFQEGLPAAPSENGSPPEGLPEPVGDEGGSADGLPENLGELDDPPEGLPGPIGEEAEGLPSAIGDPPLNNTGGEETFSGDSSDPPPESEGGKAAGEVPEEPPGGDVPPEAAAPLKSADSLEGTNMAEHVPQEALKRQGGNAWDKLAVCVGQGSAGRRLTYILRR